MYVQEANKNITICVMVQPKTTFCEEALLDITLKTILQQIGNVPRKLILFLESLKQELSYLYNLRNTEYFTKKIFYFGFNYTFQYILTVNYSKLQ